MNIFNWFKIATSRSPRPSRKSSRPSNVRLQLESLEERLTPYAVSGNLWAHPELITVSFMPDGTNFGGKTSNLQATFNTKFGSAAVWQDVFKEAAQVWAAQTNINFNFVTDSGAASGSGSYQQGDSTFGDIRIGGYNFGTGNTTLASAFLPPQVNNYSVAGDIALNTNQTFNIGSTYNLFTVASHEIGHALGLYHGAVGSIMASSYPGTLTSLQTDDINGIRNIYSANAARAKDSYDTAAANETFATASLVTASINTTTKAGVINNLDLSTSTDVDWYKFVIPSGSATTLKVKAVATGLSMLDPKIEIYDSTNALKATGNGAAYGSTASAQFTVAAGQTWYVKVYSADAKAAFKTGKYSLILNMGTGADPAVTLPTTQTANGTPLTSGGGTAITDGVETPVNGASSFKSGALVTTSFIEGGTLTPIPTGEPKIAMDANGNYVVVWMSVGQDGDQGGIYAQRYNAFGVAQGSAFKVNTTTAGDQISPAVAMQGITGDFVVTWASNGQDGSGWGIYAQRFNAAGVAQGSEFKVNTTTAGDQITPAIGMDDTGGFVIAWSSYGQDAANTWGIYAQRYTALGALVLGEFRANTTTASDQIKPGVAMDSLGNFAIGWSSYNQDAANSWGYYYQRFLSTGTKVLGETLVNTTTAGDQLRNSSVAAPDGSWIAVWSSSGQDGSGLGVYARRFSATGSPISGEIQVNTTTVGDQTNPSVTTDRYGNFYVTWQSYGQDATNTWGIYGQQFTSTGTPLGTEFKVNSTAIGDQVNPTTAMDNLGHLIVVWNGNGVNNTDGVFMQRYSVNTSAETPPVFDAWDPNGDGDEQGAIGTASVGHSPVGTNRVADGGLQSGSLPDRFGILSGPTIIGIAPVGNTQLSTNRVADAGLHSGPLTNRFGLVLDPSLLMGSHSGSNNNLNDTGSNGHQRTSANEALDADLSRGHREGDRVGASASAGTDRASNMTERDEVFSWIADDLLDGGADVEGVLALIHGNRGRE